MWIRDSHDVNLWGLGGSGDSFPNCGSPRFAGIECRIPFDFHIPDDFGQHVCSILRTFEQENVELIPA